MAAYILRNIDPKLWGKVKDRAGKEGRGLRWVILTLLGYYAEKGWPKDVRFADIDAAQEKLPTLAQRLAEGVSLAPKDATPTSEETE